MDAYAKENYEPSRPQSTTRLGDFGKPAHNVMENASNPCLHRTQGKTEDINQAPIKVGKAYDKTAEKMRDGYDKVLSYSQANPGKLIFITLGIGIGVGLLFGVN